MNTAHDLLTPRQRWATMVTIPCMLALLAFFVLHQWMGTEFFTARFAPLEALALYGPILVAFAPPVARAAYGRRNPARPFEAALNLSLAMGSLWLVIVFPFNFAHLADVLPGPARFLLDWIGDDLGRLVLILQVIISVIVAPLTMLAFFSVRPHASAP